LIQPQLGDGDGFLLYPARDHDTVVLVAIRSGNKLFGLLVAGGVEADDLAIAGEHRVSAALAIGHLQASLGVHDAQRAQLAAALGNARHIHQVTFDGFLFAAPGPGRGHKHSSHCDIDDKSARPLQHGVHFNSFRLAARNCDALHWVRGMIRAVKIFFIGCIALLAAVAQEVAPSSAEAAAQQVRQLLQSGQIDQAVEAGAAATSRWPENPETWHMAGLAHFKAGDLPRAEIELGQAVRLAPRQADVHYDLALVHLSQKKYTEAATQLEEANRIDPSNALAHIFLGRAYLNSNRTLPAIEQFKQALRIDPNIALGHYHLGFAYESLGKNPLAVAEFRKELTAHPDDPETLYQLAHALLDLGRAGEAAGYLERCRTLQPQRPQAAYDLGKALLAQNKAQAAVAVLQAAVQLSPNDPSFHYLLARALDAAGSKEAAKAELEKFRELKANQPTEGGMASGRIIK